MFDIFGIRKRRLLRQQQEAERKKKELEEILTARRQKQEAREARINEYLKYQEKEYRSKAIAFYQEDLKKVEEANTTCPVCNGKNTIHRFMRTVGKIEGGINGTYSWPYGSVSGGIEGSLDTLEVNECRDCGNQWKIKEPRHRRISEYCPNPFDEDDTRLETLYVRIKLALRDGEEPKRLSNWSSEPYKTTPREVLEYLIYKQAMSRTYDRGKVFGTIPVNFDMMSRDFNGNPYLFELPEDIWEKVKIALGREN